MAFGSLPFWLFPLNTRFSLSSYLLLYRLLHVLITGATSFQITRLLLYLNRKIPHKPPSDSQLYDSSITPWCICKMTFWMQWRSSGCKEPSTFRHSSLYWSSVPFLPSLQCSRSLVVSASLRWCSIPGSGSFHSSPEWLDLKGKLSPGSILLPHLYYSPWLQTLPPLLCSC